MSRWVKLEDVDDDDFLKIGYDDLEGEHIQAYAENEEKGWTADQVSLGGCERSPEFDREGDCGANGDNHGTDLGLRGD